jgi:hypothetical protein
MIPSYFRACGMLSASEQVQLPGFVVTCAIAFLACPRARLHDKALTLVCYTLSALSVIALGGPYFVHLFGSNGHTPDARLPVGGRLAGNARAEALRRLTACHAV